MTDHDSNRLGQVVADRILNILERQGHTLGWLTEHTNIPAATLRRHLRWDPDLLTLGEVLTIAETLNVDTTLLVSTPTPD